MTDEFLSGRVEIDLSKHATPFPRDVDVEHLENIVGAAMKRSDGSRPEESDRWLAQRVHATLRLTRREAAGQGLWDWLALVPLKEYVRWRWTNDEKVGSERFVGREKNKHAIGRLWWGAELTRNGGDYSATQLLFTKQDIQNSWFKTRLFRHRPTAIASLKVLSEFNDGKFAGDEQRDLVRGLNAAITTTMLDAVAHSKAVDADALIEWQKHQIVEMDYHKEMPEGPPEEALRDSDIANVRELLNHVVDKTIFVKRDRSRGTVAQATEIAEPS